MKSKVVVLICAWSLLTLGVAPPAMAEDPLAPGVKVIDQYTVAGPKNWFTDFEPIDSSGDIVVIVEIPKGTTGKWEVAKDGTMKWEMKNGKPRLVEYLGGYPANYGTVPKTMLTKELGGDGDPIDIILVGSQLPRGTVTKVKLVGVLRLLDGGEHDDKLLAAVKGSPEAAANSADDLNAKFNGLAKNIEQWFANYKGPGKMEAKGFGSAEEAHRLLVAAAKAFAKEAK